MNAADQMFLAAVHIFRTDKPIARNLKAEDAFYANYGGGWTEAITRFFARALPVRPAPRRVTIVPSSVKLA